MASLAAIDPTKTLGRCLIRNLDLITGRGQTIKNGFLALDGGIIAGIGNDSDLGAEFRDYPVLSAENYIVMPGLINSHTHAAMGFFRGLGHGRTDMIETFLFPAEKALTPDLIEGLSWSYLYGGLLSGVTCFVDHYYYVAGVGHALEKLGLRGVLGETVADLGGAFPGAEAEQRATAFIENWPFSKRITPAVAPHAADTVSAKLFARLVGLAQRHDLPIHLHLSQSSGERQRVLSREKLSPVQFAHRCGVLGPKTLAVHLITADPTDIAILKGQGVTAGYCPGSQLIYEKLAPIAELRRQGVPIAIGTDCAASNDGADLLAELRLAQFLDLNINRDQAERSLGQALGQVTNIPAEALGLAKTCGELKAGLAADMVFLEKTLDIQPISDLNAILHYSVGSQQVRHVMVDGQWVLWNRAPVRYSLEAMQLAYQEALQRLHRTLNL